VKLRGRPEAPHGTEGAQSLGARGAKPEAPHGPLQRLLEDAFIEATVRARRNRRNNRRQGAASSDRIPDCRRAHKGCVKRRVFGSGSQLFMSFKVRLGCGL
jgi:hypothetical protein